MGKLPECVTRQGQACGSASAEYRRSCRFETKTDYITHAAGSADVHIGDGWFSWGLGAAECDEHMRAWATAGQTSSISRSPLSHAHASASRHDLAAYCRRPVVANSTSCAAVGGPHRCPASSHRQHSDDDSEDADYHRMDSSGMGLGISIDETEMAGLPSPLGSPTLSRSTSALSRTSSAASTAPPSPTAAPTLCGVTCRIPAGSRVMIVGSVGSGKSSLLQCLLGEMHRQSGTVQLSHRVAYTSQVAFLQSASIRNNILLGLPSTKRTTSKYCTRARCWTTSLDCRLVMARWSVRTG